MRVPREQVVLITGGTRGIGRAAALDLARRGHRVIATGRNQSLLAALAEEGRRASLPLTAASLDVTSPEAVQRVVAGVVHDFGRLDALVNNAGYGISGAMEELDRDEVQALFDTNFFAVLTLSRAVLPHMRGQGFGTIVNVGSIAGKISPPMEGAYAATKFALRAVSRAMRLEVAAFGVRVVLIEPGVIQTDFLENKVTGRRVLQEGSPYLAMSRDSALKEAARTVVARGPERVGLKIRQVIEARSPRASYPVGIDARAGVLATRLLPDAVLDFFLRRAILGR